MYNNLYNFNCAVIAIHYNYMCIFFITLKMAT